MLYFKHSELAEQYNVSLRTVHNWIDAAKVDKLNLDLYPEGNKLYIANTSKNLATLAQLVEERRKYRNTKASKIITPNPEFYQLFNDEQVYDIITNLEIHHEIPRQYNYFDGGAKNWERYVERLASEDAPNILTGTMELLSVNQSYIDSLLTNYSRVNVVDVGVGNAHPVKDFIAHLLSRKKLGRYIALDISPSMLVIAEQNIRRWFKGQVQFEGYQYDVNYDRFSPLLIKDYMKNEVNNTVNLVLLFGGTLSNMRYPDNGFKMIHDSMGIHDILIYATKLDTETSRKYFDFNSKPGNTALSPNHRLIFDLLNIDDSFYGIEMGYDSISGQRYIRVRLKVAITIQFIHNGGCRTISLNKGDTILLWRATQHALADIMDQFEKNDFYLLHASQTDDQEYILTVSRVKRS